MRFTRTRFLFFMLIGLCLAGFTSKPGDLSTDGTGTQDAASQNLGGDELLALKSYTPKEMRPDIQYSHVKISGVVINGSGGTLPQNSQIMLTIFQKDEAIAHFDCFTDQSGRYILKNVPWRSIYSYRTSISYNGIEYKSEMVSADVFNSATEIYLPLIVYENSINSQFLRINRLFISFDFTDPGQVHVVESFVIFNPTSLVIIPESEILPVLDFSLPEGASSVEFPEGNGDNSLRSTRKGFGDWQPIMPGNGHQVMVQYTIPFDNQKTISVNVPVATESITVSIKEKDVEISGSNLDVVSVKSSGEEDITLYNSPSLRAGGKLSLKFITRTHMYREWISGFLFLLVLAGSFLWLMKNKQFILNGTKAENTDSMDILLDAIIALDDRYRAGELKQSTYQQLRAELVRQVKSLNEKNSK